MDIDTDKVWIVVAAYNEEEVIGDVIEELKQKYSNVVVVDDGSSDGTSGIAENCGANVIRHPVNLGQGAALQTGIAYSLKKGASHIVTFDADGQHRVEDIDVLFSAISEASADVAIGSRFLGHAENISRSRRLVLSAARLFTYLTTGIRMTDAHNGLRVFSRESAQQIDIKQNGMAHASEIVEQIAKYKLILTEAPVTIKYTEYSLKKGQKLGNSVSILIELISSRLYK